MMSEGNIYLSKIRLKENCGRLNTIINVKRRFDLSLDAAKYFVDELLEKREKYVDDFNANMLKECFDFESEVMVSTGEPYVINETKYAILYAGEMMAAEEWYKNLSDEDRRHADFLINNNKR